MRLTMGWVVRVACDTIAFTRIAFDDGTSFDVHYGGTDDSVRDGVTIGRVAHVRDSRSGLLDEWFATSDATADRPRWVGGFRSKVEATLFLLGARIERDMPTDALHGHTPALDTGQCTGDR